MAIALKLGSDGNLQQLQVSDTLQVDAIDLLSATGTLSIGAGMGVSDDIQLGSAVSLVTILGDGEVDGDLTVSGSLDFTDTSVQIWRDGNDLKFKDVTTTTKTLSELSASSSGLENIVEDTTPQLGGDLDMNGKKIIYSGAGGDIVSCPGSGTVLFGSSSNATVTVESQNNVKLRAGAKDLLQANTYGDILFHVDSAVKGGNIAWATFQTTPSAVLALGNTSWAYVGLYASTQFDFNFAAGTKYSFASGSASFYNPLSMQSQNITNIKSASFGSAVYNNGTKTANFAINFSTNGHKQEVTLGANVSITSFTFPGTGNYTLIVKQDGTGGRTLGVPAAIHAPGGKTTGLVLSTDPNAVDIMTIVNDGGSNPKAALTKDFKA